jgi:bifunctional non-homologous end joining protein LigD
MLKLKAAASETNPFRGKEAPRKKTRMHWLKPELVAEIEFYRIQRLRHDPAGRV